MSGGPEVSSEPSVHTLMQRVARLERELFYLQDRVTCAERALLAAHGTAWMRQITLVDGEKGKLNEPASE